MKNFLLDMMKADAQSMAMTNEKRLAGITNIAGGFFLASVNLAYDSMGRIHTVTERKANGGLYQTEILYEGNRVVVSKYDGEEHHLADRCEMTLHEGRVADCHITLDMLNETVDETLHLNYSAEGYLLGVEMDTAANGRTIRSEVRMHWEEGNLVKVENLIGSTVYGSYEFRCGRTLNPSGHMLTNLLLADELCDVFMNFGCPDIFGKAPRNMIKKCIKTNYENGAAINTTYEISYHGNGYLKRIKKLQDGGNPNKDYHMLVFDWQS